MSCSLNCPKYEGEEEPEEEREEEYERDRERGGGPYERTGKRLRTDPLSEVPSNLHAVSNGHFGTGTPRP